MNQSRVVPLLLSGISISAAATAMGQAVPGAASSPARQAPMEKLSTQQLSTQYLMQNNGGSLFAAQAEQEMATNPGKNGSTGNIYAVTPPEPHVLKKHDHVNILVNEESKSQTTGSSDQERAVDFDAKVDAFVKFNLAKLSLQGGAGGANPPEVKLEGSRDFKGTGEYDRTDTMTTRLESEVVDVKPNGNLVVQARRHLKIDEEEITVTLTGECAAKDVDATDSVLSTQLVDLDLQKVTKGEVHDTAKRGLIHRLLDILNPF
jgi:flagellar L-ring protein precursor FlgH